MIYEEYNKFREDMFAEASKISDNKSIEYTISNEDKFYNFKHVAERLGITAKQALMVYVLKHVDAICNDAKTGKTHSDETTYQRCLDVVNYMVLYAAMEKEHPHANNTKQNGIKTSESISESENGSEPSQWNDLQRTT